MTSHLLGGCCYRRELTSIEKIGKDEKCRFASPENDPVSYMKM